MNASQPGKRSPAAPVVMDVRASRKAAAAARAAVRPRGAMLRAPVAGHAPKGAKGARAAVEWRRVVAADRMGNGRAAAASSAQGGWCTAWTVGAAAEACFSAPTHITACDGGGRLCRHGAQQPHGGASAATRRVRTQQTPRPRKRE